MDGVDGAHWLRAAELGGAVEAQLVDGDDVDALPVVPQRAPITLAVAWGDWLGPVALVLGALLLVSRPGRSAGSARSPRRRAA